MKLVLLLVGLLALAQAAPLVTNINSYAANVPEANKNFPSGMYTTWDFNGVTPSTCLGTVPGNPACPPQLVSQQFSVPSGGSVINVPCAAPATGCPATSVSGRAKAAAIGPGVPLTIALGSASTGFGFLGGVTVATTLSVTVNNANIACPAANPGCASRTLTVTPGATWKLFWGVQAPYQDTFTSVTISSSVATVLTIDDFFYGQTGYYCLGYEDTNTCAFRINLLELPDATVNVQLLGNLVNNQNNIQSNPTLSAVGNRVVLVCVPDVLPKVVISENSVQYVSEQDGKPDCTTIGFHSCYLDPRATLQVPVDCWPQLDYNQNNGGGAPAYGARIALWQSSVADQSPVLANNVPFRVVDPTRNLTVPFAPMPVYSVLAVRQIFSSLSWFLVVGGVDQNNVLDAPTLTTYDCRKSAQTPATLARDRGVCKSYFTGPEQFVRLSSQLIVRAKCSDNAQPPMVSGVNLVISAPITDLSSQIPIQYFYNGVGNVDTSVCVISAGLYSVQASENGATAFAQTTNCAVGPASQCNGTPLDVVGVIQATGCTRVAPCGGVLPPAYPTAGGNADGSYTVNLSYDNAVFRSFAVDPNNVGSVCVLNLNGVALSMPVPGTAMAGEPTTASSAVTATFDCTDQFSTPGFCLRTGVTGPAISAPLSLFSVLRVPLANMPANSVNFIVKLVTSDGTTPAVGLLPARPAGVNQGDAFCRRGAANYDVCVPAIGSDRVNAACGTSYYPRAISVSAEECGPNTASITCAVTGKRQERDTGECITASADVDCRTSTTCVAPIVQELCVWDMLYLPMYAAPARGVAVELYAQRNQNNPVRAAVDNQGGMPRSYYVLAGSLFVRVLDNPAVGVPPIGQGVPNAPSIFTKVECELSSTCTLNDFLSVLDVAGDQTVAAMVVPTADRNAPDVFCSGITYSDNYNRFGADCFSSPGSCPPAPKQVLEGASAALSVGGRVFRPAFALAGCTAPTCTPEKVVVLRTTLNNYTIDYSWAGLSKTVTGLTCTARNCAAAPCVVRWAPVDEQCPELHRHVHIDPTGATLSSPAQGFFAGDDDAHTHKYMFWRPAPVSATTLSVNSATLCRENILTNTRTDNLFWNNRACRSLQDRFFFTDNTNQFDRFFVLAPNAGAAPIPVTITVGCTAASYTLTCGAEPSQTGLKFVVPASSIAAGVTPCTPARNIWWHRCTWNAAPALLGGRQYYPGVPYVINAVGVPTLVDALTCAPVADNTYDWWTPLRPFITNSIDLRILPDGNQGLLPKFNTLPVGAPVPPGAEPNGDLTVAAENDLDQDGYRGKAYVDFNGGDTARRNPFDLSICCAACGAKRSLLEEARELSTRVSERAVGGACPPVQRPISCANPWLKPEVGGFDNLVCLLAGGSYSYKVQELFRNENRQLYAPEPATCPVSAAYAEWDQRIKDCRPTTCISPPPTSVPLRYSAGTWFSANVTKNIVNLQPNFLVTLPTYSSNFQCRRGWTTNNFHQHTLLRPNRLLGPAEANLPYLRDAPYQLASNDRNLVSTSIDYSCIPPVANGLFCAPNNVTIVALKKRDQL